MQYAHSSSVAVTDPGFASGGGGGGNLEFRSSLDLIKVQTKVQQIILPRVTVDWILSQAYYISSSFYSSMVIIVYIILV